MIIVQEIASKKTEKLLKESEEQNKIQLKQEKDKQQKAYISMSKQKYKEAEGKPPTNQDVYDYINEAALGNKPDAVPGIIHPDKLKPIETDTSQSEKTSSGGANEGPTSDRIFTGCTPKNCQGFYEKIKKEGIIPIEQVVSAPMIDKLGGVEEGHAAVTPKSQNGLIMCIPQLEDAYKRFTMDKWFENMRGNQEKRCLICLYRGFRDICLKRNIELDKELQADVPDNYSIPRKEPVSENDSSTPTDDDTKSEEPDEDKSPKKTKPKRPRALSAIASVKTEDGKEPPIQIITDGRNRDKYIWIKISAAPDCLKGVVDNSFDSSEQTMSKLINLDTPLYPEALQSPVPTEVPEQVQEKESTDTS